MSFLLTSPHRYLKLLSLLSIITIEIVTNKNKKILPTFLKTRMHQAFPLDQWTHPTPLSLFFSTKYSQSAHEGSDGMVKLTKT